MRVGRVFPIHFFPHIAQREATTLRALQRTEKTMKKAHALSQHDELSRNPELMGKTCKIQLT